MAKTKDTKITSVEQLQKKMSACTECLNKKFNGEDGKRHLLVCGGTGCLSSHSKEIRESFEKEQRDFILKQKIHKLNEELGINVDKQTEASIYAERVEKLDSPDSKTFKAHFHSNIRGGKNV